ncbi:hypothetical protein GCM10023107_92100 [Actinoplanes octamycinicus]
MIKTDGPNYVGQVDLTRGQRAPVRSGQERSALEDVQHGEPTAVGGALKDGQDVRAVGSQREFCNLCELFVRESGGIVHSPHTATWPNGFGGSIIDPRYL